MTIQQIIESLEKLNLAISPNNEVKELIRNIGDSNIGFMITDLDISKIIERAVPNNDKEPIFNSVSRISIKHSDLNKDYQRASTPTNTMFYGSVIMEGESIKHERIIGATESCDLIRNNNIAEGECLITFGKWKIREKLSLVTIVDPERKYNIKHLNNLVNDYKVRLGEQNGDTKKLLKYITKEFSKKVNKNCDYMISALFTELLMENSSLDGVIYPSVQAQGEGLCVAIHPSSIHKIELVKVFQCKAVKKSNHIDLLNVRYCEVSSNSDKFELKEII